ncbi:hypothetical protein FOCC_FOCC012230 [Frankliniella occidentalis]|nr:hypothetical protein FOCC_FOCC012230 [Frankliniella occidentalis]
MKYTMMYFISLTLYLELPKSPIIEKANNQGGKAKQKKQKTPIVSESKRKNPQREARSVSQRPNEAKADSDQSNSDSDDESDDSKDNSSSISDFQELIDSESEEEQEGSGEEEQEESVEESPVNRRKNQTVGQNKETNDHTQSEDEDEDDPDPDKSNEESGESDSETEGTGPTADNSATKVTSTEKKRQRKLLRDSGKQYITRTGKVMARKKWKRAHVCKRNYCHEKVPPQVGKKLFKEYWQQKSHNKRRAYVAARIEREEVKRRRSREGNEKRQKNQSNNYYLEINGKREKVCRSTMRGTLGETDRFIRGVADAKKDSTSGITPDDKRGKKVPPHALVNTGKGEAVNRHIASFPAYVSHYCRSKTNDQKYLRSDLTVAEMYRLYQQEPDNPAVSLSTYTKLFKLTGLKIHPPQTDGCDTCDSLEISIKDAGDDLRKSLKIEKEMHIRKSEKAYELKKKAKAAAKENPTSRVLVMDLQQCLPTPYLKCKKIYYSRQLYVLNFTIHDCSTGLTHCYMWNEVEGNRGSNEIATCLLQHILQSVPDEVTKLTIFSD